MFLLNHVQLHSPPPFPGMQQATQQNTNKQVVTKGKFLSLHLDTTNALVNIGSQNDSFPKLLLNKSSDQEGTRPSIMICLMGYQKSLYKKNPCNSH